MLTRGKFTPSYVGFKVEITVDTPQGYHVVRHVEEYTTLAEAEARLLELDTMGWQKLEYDLRHCLAKDDEYLYATAYEHTPEGVYELTSRPEPAPSPARPPGGETARSPAGGP